MDDPLVEISDGKLRGKVIKNHKGENVYAFLGIPFGKPPVGELRFKAPLPVEPWTGIKDATEEGNPCYQKFMFGNTFIGSEDCLNLNVFTRSLSENQQLKPVLFYIHGGAFVSGSNGTDLISPGFLMMEDIVFVSVNYRLGVLGFLSLSDTSLEVPGNAGLKDQLLALKWVQKNIKTFGGDPNNVTISGTSAGAVSVNYHMLSRASKGLFRKAIMQSGSVFNPWPHLHPKSLDILKHMGLNCKSDEEILDKLRNVPVNELIKAQNQLERENVDSTFRTFAPCVEKPNPSAFLTKKPINLITSGDYNKVPVLISYTSNEGLYIEMNPKEVKKLPVYQYIPPQIVLPEDNVTRVKLLEELRAVYSNEKYKNNKYLAASDSMFIAGIIGLARNLAKTSPYPIYLYKFDVLASRNLVRQMFSLSDDLPGASHGDDVGYLFDCVILQDYPNGPGTIEDITMYRTIKFWTNFAKYGNPNPNPSEFNLSWLPVSKDTLHYLHFGTELICKINPEEDRMKVWSKIYNSHEDTKGFIPVDVGPIIKSSKL